MTSSEAGPLDMTLVLKHKFRVLHRALMPRHTEGLCRHDPLFTSLHVLFYFYLCFFVCIREKGFLFVMGLGPPFATFCDYVLVYIIGFSALSYAFNYILQINELVASVLTINDCDP